MGILFLELADVLAVHADQISRYGGSGGIRDRGLLESAVSMPRTAFAGDYAHGDLFEMAAAYLYHLAMNHPFVDGNKRTALVCALVFLEFNGIGIKPDHGAFTEFVFAVAKGQKDKSQVASFLKKHAEPAD